MITTMVYRIYVCWHLSNSGFNTDELHQQACHLKHLYIYTTIVEVLKSGGTNKWRNTNSTLLNNRFKMQRNVICFFITIMTSCGVAVTIFETEYSHCPNFTKKQSILRTNCLHSTQMYVRYTLT